MIIGMDHTGFVVRDLDRAVAFYRDVIGLKITRTVERHGPIGKVVGYENAHLKAVLLNTGQGHQIELIQYLSPRPAERPTRERSVIGASHLALQVKDIDEVYERLAAGGAIGMNPPAEFVPGRKACYIQDPEGNWLELFEILE